MRVALATLALLLAAPAHGGAPFPSRGGTSGTLDVPDGEALALGAAALGLELRLAHASEQPTSVGPSPIALALGLGHRLEVGMSLREGGVAGDPRPSPLLFGGALKYHLRDAPDRKSLSPSLALEARLDRANLEPTPAVRLAASTHAGERVRFAAVAGLELGGPRTLTPGPSAGLAASMDPVDGSQLDFEGLWVSGGPMLATAARYAPLETVGLSLALTWLPFTREVAVSVGVGFAVAPPPRPPPPPEIALAKPAAPVAKKVTFRDEVPHFRLKIRPTAMPSESGGRHSGDAGAPIARAAEPTARLPKPVKQPEPAKPPEPAVVVAPEPVKPPEPAKAPEPTVAVAPEPPKPPEPTVAVAPEPVKPAEPTVVLAPEPVKPPEPTVVLAPEPAKLPPAPAPGVIAAEVLKNLNEVVQKFQPAPTPKVYRRTPTKAPAALASPVLPKRVRIPTGHGRSAMRDVVEATLIDLRYSNVPPTDEQVQQLLELARNANRDGRELYLWGRSPGDALVTTAAQRAAEILEIVVSSGALPRERVHVGATFWAPNSTVDVVATVVEGAAEQPPPPPGETP